MRAARVPSGERHGNAKLTDAKVREMRERYRRGGISILDLSVEYGIEYSTCRSALNGTSWKHVGGPVRQCQHCNGTGVEQ